MYKISMSHVGHVFQVLKLVVTCERIIASPCPPPLTTYSLCFPMIVLLPQPTISEPTIKHTNTTVTYRDGRASGKASAVRPSSVAEASYYNTDSIIGSISTRLSLSASPRAMI